MTDTEAEVARTMVERVDEFDHAAKVYNGVAFDTHASYSEARDTYIRTRRALAPAARALHDAIELDATRRAAEAGSPAARMLEPNGGR